MNIDIKKSIWINKCYKNCNLFATYYLIAFRIETNHFDDDNRGLESKYEYVTFNKWIKYFEKNIDSHYIDLDILNLLYTQLHGMIILNTTHVLISKYRRQARVTWSDEKL